MRNFTVLLCVVALAGQALAAPALEGPTHLSFPAAGDTGTVAINLTGVETGLSGYNLTLSLSPAGIAEIESVAFPSWVRIPVNGTLPASSTYLQAVDLDRNAEPGTSPLPLLTATLRAIVDGETTLAVVPVIVDDDLGGRYALDPLKIAVRVGAAPPETATSDTMPRTLRPSSSSGGVQPQGTSTATDTLPGPDTPISSATVGSVTTTYPPVSLSPPITTPAGELATPSTKTTQGFDCTTVCFAGLLISLLALLGWKQR